MLYDIDRALLLMKEKQKSRQFQDLVYDIESYIIDITYSSVDRLDENSPEFQEKKGRAVLRDIILNEKERDRVLSTLTSVLCDMGVPRQVKGFRILEDCVLEAARERVNNRPYYLMNVYPVLAKKYSVKPNNAEKLCRYACSFIEITPFVAAKYPELEVLTRRSYENVTLKEVVDALVELVVKNCKLRIRKR